VQWCLLATHHFPLLCSAIHVLTSACSSDSDVGAHEDQEQNQESVVNINSSDSGVEVLFEGDDDGDDDDAGDGGELSSEDEYARDIAAALQGPDSSAAAAAATLRLPPAITSRVMQRRREWRSELVAAAHEPEGFSSKQVGGCISHLTPHTSHLTPHTSHLTPHTSHIRS
jgi:hypothetical protein